MSAEFRLHACFLACVCEKAPHLGVAWIGAHFTLDFFADISGFFTRRRCWDSLSLLVATLLCTFLSQMSLEEIYDVFFWCCKCDFTFASASEDFPPLTRFDPADDDIPT